MADSSLKRPTKGCHGLPLHLKGLDVCLEYICRFALNVTDELVNDGCSGSTKVKVDFVGLPQQSGL